MNLNDSQRDHVRAWINQGLQPAEIQSRLADEFGVRLTYMEVRFLLDDLQVQIKDKEPPTPFPPNNLSTPAKNSTDATPSKPVADHPDDAWSSGVSVTVDQVTRAGMVVSGSVTFTDGKQADWHLDQFGRLGLAPMEQGYRPSQDDLLRFQTELQSVLARMGY